MSKYIVTSRAESAAAAMTEILRADPTARLVKKLSFEEQLVEVSGENADFLKKLSETSVFVRHIFPAQAASVSADVLPLLSSCLRPLAEKLDKNASFSCQYRINGTSALKQSVKAQMAAFEESLVSGGFTANDKRPEQIISLYVDGGAVYAGLSDAHENLSCYNGGRRRFKRTDDVISRAGFKLLEALDVFGVALPENGFALDLGAAPGGFSRVLIERGLNVVGVDPAHMDERLLSSPNFTHFRGLAQNFVSNERFDIITNDIKADAFESARITVAASVFLKPGGQIITTLKLPDKNQLKKTQNVLKLFAERFCAVKARQLFNNRSEVTVWLKSICPESEGIRQ